jgi:hypothetical protein
VRCDDPGVSRRALLVLVPALLLTGCGGARTPAPPGSAALRPAAERALLQRHRPLFVMDARDDDRPTRVEALLRRAVLRTTGGRVLAPRPTARDLRAPGSDEVLDGPDDGAPSVGPAVYGAVRRERGRTWLQYWAFLPDNPQDRHPLRTGRHEGDWEFAQVGLGPAGTPRVVTVAQHKWAEGCPWGEVRREGPRPVLFPANGSHATYLSPGEHGRPWPDPDDEARGDGPRVDPVLLDLDRQPWRSWAGRWGGSTASPLLPVEASSPVGPAFQRDGRDGTPTTFHEDARACGSGAPTAKRDGAAVAAAVVLGGALLLLRRTRRRRRRAPRPAPVP